MKETETINVTMERKLEDMSALIYTEAGMASILGQSNVGLGSCGIKEGFVEYTYSEAILIIKQIDRLILSAPKYLRKRIWSTRMSFVFAFGPEMEASLSCSTAEKLGSL